MNILCECPWHIFNNWHSKNSVALLYLYICVSYVCVCVSIFTENYLISVNYSPSCCPIFAQETKKLKRSLQQ